MCARLNKHIVKHPFFEGSHSLLLVLLKLLNSLFALCLDIVRHTSDLLRFKSEGNGESTERTGERDRRLTFAIRKLRVNISLFIF